MDCNSTTLSQHMNPIAEVEEAFADNEGGSSKDCVWRKIVNQHTIEEFKALSPSFYTVEKHTPSMDTFLEVVCDRSASSQRAEAGVGAAASYGERIRLHMGALREKGVTQIRFVGDSVMVIICHLPRPPHSHMAHTSRHVVQVAVTLLLTGRLILLVFFFFFFLNN